MDLPSNELNTIRALSGFGVSASIVDKLEEAGEGAIGGIKLPGKIAVVPSSEIELAQADLTGTIAFNPKGLAAIIARFSDDKSACLAVSKIMEEELLHAVHQLCPSFAVSASLFAKAATCGDMAPIKAAASALSLYQRCSSPSAGQTQLSMAALATNPALMQQGFGELLRMAAQFHVTGIPTELAIRPWNKLQMDQLGQISRSKMASWHKELDAGNWGVRARNQYRLLCSILEVP